jgi:hypothetical protein
MAHIAQVDYYISKIVDEFHSKLRFFIDVDDGKTQPGCTTDLCSHYYAVKLYIDLINGKPYGYYTCESLKELDGR